MTRRCVLFVAALFLAAVGASAGAQAPASHQIVGTIVSIDLARNQIVVSGRVRSGKARQISMAVTDHTKIVSGTQARPLSALQAGDPATVTFTKKGAVHIAEVISVQPPPVSAPLNPGNAPR